MYEGKGPLRRSLIPVPANEPEMIAQYRSSGADEVFLDLEDSLAADEKVAARSTLIKSIGAAEWSDIKLSYRINSPRTKWWYADVIEVIESVGEKIDSIVIPKIEDRFEILIVSELLQKVELNSSIPVGEIGLTLQVETATGIQQLPTLTDLPERLCGFVFGPGDYLTSLGVQTLGDKREIPDYYWYYALTQLSHAAASHDVVAIDGPYPDLEDTDGFRRACHQCQILGYDGKIALTKNQVDIANDIFAPSAAEIERASEIVTRYEEASEPSQAQLNGRLIGADTYELARRTLSKASYVDE